MKMLLTAAAAAAAAATIVIFHVLEHVQSSLIMELGSKC